MEIREQGIHHAKAIWRVYVQIGLAGPRAHRARRRDGCKDAERRWAQPGQPPTAPDERIRGEWTRFQKEGPPPAQSAARMAKRFPTSAWLRRQVQAFPSPARFSSPSE